MALKGFYFSMDAIIGLMIIGLAAGLIGSTSQISKGVSGDEVSYDRSAAQAADISYLMRREGLSAVNASYRDNLVESTEVERGFSIDRAILKLYNEDSSPEELAGNYLDTFPRRSGLYIEGEEIIPVDANETSASSFVVPGDEGAARFTVVVAE
ncbi:MAG: hypothetical protein ACLFTA_02965 [Candidatus Nanohaloarchaea archaeon]